MIGMSGKETIPGLLPHLFRLEYSKMTAVLCRHFGLKHIEIAEDIASETFLKAAETWALNGVPENPTAWLYTVAKNKTKDHLKHLAIFENKVKGAVIPEEIQLEPDFDRQTIEDSQLAMIFAVCNPANAKAAQICLALQVLCGFSIGEIANAFLTQKETIKKRLQRARTNLRKDHFRLDILPETAVRQRLDTVLSTLYLLFNEGYFSQSGNLLIRKDLCSEAMRLNLVLIQNPLTNTPRTNALLALMCFQCSRLEARTDATGNTVLFEEQDRALWDQELIDQGNYYLVNACTGDEISKYHLEAGIAYWHTTPTDNDKWVSILQLYDQLVLLEFSPVTALNRAFAFSKVYGKEQAIIEAEKLELTTLTHYHSLLGYLYTGINRAEAGKHYKEAIRYAKSPAEKVNLQKSIVLLNCKIK